MTRRQLTALVTAWHRDNRTLFGEARQARQRALWDALASAGGEHDTGDLLAVCDDVGPFVAVFEWGEQTLCPRAKGNPERLAGLRKLNLERFAAKRKAVPA